LTIGGSIVEDDEKLNGVEMDNVCVPNVGSGVHETLPFNVMETIRALLKNDTINDNNDSNS